MNFVILLFQISGVSGVANTMNHARLLSLATMLVVSNLMMSCALQPPISDAVVTGKYAEASTDEVFRKVQTEYTHAQSDGLDFFAPQTFRQGQQALQMAADLRAGRADDMEVLKSLYLAEQQLSVCKQVKTMAEQRIPDVLKGLDVLRSKNVEQSYRDEFGAILWHTGKLLNHLEDTVLGKPVNVTVSENFDKQKQKLLQAMNTLEIKAVIFNALNDSHVVFKEVENLGGKHLAPKTFQQAEKVFQQANKIIKQNVKDSGAITQAAKRYNFAVFHALHVTRAVAELHSLGNSDYEDYILELENKLQPIAQAFGYEDIRNHGLQEQMQLLTSLASRFMARKSAPTQAQNSQAVAQTVEGSPEFKELKTKYQNALQQIQELNNRIAQWQNENPQERVLLSKQQLETKHKVGELEQQVSKLLLENNDLKAERDSLQNKLNTQLGEK